MAIVDKDDWVQRLQADGDVKDQARQELESILGRGLTVAQQKSPYHQHGLEVEDLVHDALDKIMRDLDHFQGRSKFTTWAMTVATRVAIGEMRQAHFANVEIGKLTENSLGFEASVTDGASAEKVAMIEKLRELSDTKLSKLQRDAFHSLLNGVPVEVFAKKTGIDRNTAYKSINEARNTLLRGFEQAGYEAKQIQSVFS